MPSDRGQQALSEELELSNIDGTLAHKFEIAVDEYGRLLYDEGSVPAEGSEPGTELTKTWDYFGGGMGETYDFQDRFGYKAGGYYFANNWQVSNPFRPRPRQELTTLTLTDNPSPVTQMFEAASASGIKYLYALTDTYIYKTQISGTPTLKNTKNLLIPESQFATGSYTCGATAPTFTVPFTIKALIIKAIDGAYPAAFKTDDMPYGMYKQATGLIPSLTTGVALSGGNATVTTASGFTAVYYLGTTYAWMAFGGDNVKTSYFTGDGTDTKDITGLGWEPDALFLWNLESSTSYPVYFRNKTCTADLTMSLGGAVKPIADVIGPTAGWPTNDGFEVGTLGNVVKSGGSNMFYIALKADTDALEVGSYTGTGADLAVTTPNFATTYALIYADNQDLPAVHRSNYNTGDSSMYFTATVNAANLVQTLTSTGFTLGDSTPPTINNGANTFYYLVLRTDPAGDTVCGQPAKWNEIWELPLGDLVNRIALTTIVDGTGNDTWTTRATGSPKATHLCVVENELVRASVSRMVDKCSALDTDVDGNWTGDYYVGPPGTVITKLVNIGGECGVGTTDGFYLFDLVSTSRQQLPLLAGIKDDDNAKGTIVVGNLVLIPTVDGYWRWVGGSSVQVGPDAQRDYVSVAGPSTIPIKLKHYGSAFLGTYIYNACYDGTNYHIIYTQLSSSQPTLLNAKWDFLVTSTTAMKELYVDSERRLWFSYGNDLGWIQLSRGGAPEGGNWGQASTTGYFYHPITKMGTEALKRLRLVELQLDDWIANFTFGCGVYRDGAAVETVGSAIAVDGVGECFWTAGTNDTAREIQLRTYWTGAAGLVPSATAPSIRRVTLHAEALDEDADLIVCSVKLDANAKERKAIIDVHLNAGPFKLKNPLTGTKETVILYKRRIYSLQQQGTAPPIAACELRFRRSDTS